MKGTYVDWFAGKRYQRYQTPDKLFARLNARYHFDLDGAADEENHLLPDFSSPDHPVSWQGR